MSQLTDFLAAQVKMRRKSLGMSQEQFAAQTGLSLPLISEIERGIANPTLQTLEKIAVFLAVRPSELIDFDGTIDSHDRVKDRLQQNLEQLSVKQLKTLLTIVQLIQE